MFTGQLYVLSKGGVVRLSEEAKTSHRSRQLARLGHFCYSILNDTGEIHRYFLATRPNKRMLRSIKKRHKRFLNSRIRPKI